LEIGGGMHLTVAVARAEIDIDDATIEPKNRE
jgi:hypothetical protein